MRDQIIVQYVGFAAKALVREYTFAVRGAETVPREYTLTIANEAFQAHRARYQDAPQICSLRLRRELATNANQPPTSEFCITDAELADYQGGTRAEGPARLCCTPGRLTSRSPRRIAFGRERKNPCHK